MKKVVSALLAVACVSALFVSCSKKEAVANADVATGYTFGEEKTFRSEQPVTYSMFFSDASWYPKIETWETEGVFKNIEDLDEGLGKICI